MGIALIFNYRLFGERNMGGVISRVTKPVRKVIKEVVPKPIKEAAEAVATPVMKEIAPKAAAKTPAQAAAKTPAQAAGMAAADAGAKAATAMTATPTAPTRQVAQTGAGAYDRRRRRGMATRTRRTGARGVLGAAPVERKTILGG